ncbi:IclR family transcriptional regulator [Salinadaptatus halalkaliphilus]|uniref:IclR family transcriptional regulator n=1 Tax=Salinadaptatus halalkaliphilus TaxID=2419781 RepID=A0A4V3VKU1_9EURY|nr:IclR family transcriptional regulator [Salinadaptatus halalkaliphilus]THE63017.1 IclR family transcriptional regulator [Salinadaptatus halalkaliphilus]
MTEKSQNRNRVKSIGKAFDIVDIVADQNGARVSTIADDLEMAKSTVHLHLQTLEDEGLLRQEGKEYRLGLRFLDFGYRAREDQPISTVAHPEIEELAAETGETVWVVTEENGQCIYLDSATGDRALHTRGRIGRQSHMHYLAAGKAILAELPADRVDAIVDRHGLPAATDRTIDSRDALFETLERVRDRGYAINDGEEVDGVYAVAAPIVVDKTVLGAISVSGPEHRLKRDTVHSTVIEALLATANAVTLKAEQW